MKISEIEGKILAAIGTRGDISISELAKITKLRSHVCRNAINSLFKKEIIYRRVAINPCHFGFTIFGIWFALSPKMHRVRPKFLKWAIENSKISYLGEFEGEYPFKMDVCARNVMELNETLKELNSNFGDIITKSNLNCIISITDFGYKFLAPQNQASQLIEIGYVPDVIQIDPLDHKILKILGSSRNSSHAEMARKLGMAISTFEYRVKNLREKKVIAGYEVVSEVESIQSLGLVSYVQRIQLSSLSQSTIEAVKKFAFTDPSVYVLTHSVGTYQIELCTAGTSHKSERAFRLRLENALGDYLKGHESLGIIKHHKINTYPFD